MKPVIIVSFIGLIGLLPASALAAGEHDAHAGHVASKAPAEPPLSEGVVKKVDKAAGEVVIQHGQLDSIGMPPMTMAFRAAEPGLLEQVKVGDKIRFAVEKVRGVVTVTAVEVVQ